MWVLCAVNFFPQFLKILLMFVVKKNDGYYVPTHIGTQYVLSLSWCCTCVKTIMCWEWGGTNQSTPCLDIRLKALHSCGFVSFLPSEPTRWHYSVSAQDISLFPLIARTCSLCLRKTCNTALWFSGESMFFAFRFMSAGLRLRLWTGKWEADGWMIMQGFTCLQCCDMKM